MQLIPPHPLLHHQRVRVCVFACVFPSFTCFFLCVCSRHCDLLTMHAFTTSLCVVCCCVRVCPSCRKTITVRILDREEYNKQSSFHVLLESPRWMRSGTEQTGVRANHDAGNPQSTGPSAPRRLVHVAGLSATNAEPTPNRRGCSLSSAVHDELCTLADKETGCLLKIAYC